METKYWKSWLMSLLFQDRGAGESATPTPHNDHPSPSRFTPRNAKNRLIYRAFSSDWFHACAFLSEFAEYSRSPQAWLDSKACHRVTIT
jgi:hypothetical protein